MMKHLGLKQIAIAAALTTATGSMASASSLYWVVGNLVTNSCVIVSQSPVVSPLGPVWFGNGPHKSFDDAKLARQGISACPRSEETTSRN